ncbi:MAG: hypothetical protein LBG11_03995 [Bifidobacteriaceae bacterium]|jgi:hypothetical protein|nr:hypothetical protein [Bifidobacteriaceae bacterium]
MSRQNVTWFCGNNRAGSGPGSEILWALVGLWFGRTDVGDTPSVAVGAGLCAARVPYDLFMRKRTQLAVVLSAAGGLVMGGCSGGPDVASLGGTGAAEGKTQSEIARAMVECLRAEGVSAYEQNLDGVADGMEGQVNVAFATEGRILYLSDGAQESMDQAGYTGSDEQREAEWEQVQALASKYVGAAGSAAAQGEPFLIIGITDYTEAWVKCLDETGYTDPFGEMAQQSQAAVTQLALDATLAWLKCARDNGYPRLEDPPAPQVDDYATQPMALLPGDMTEAQLRELLEACPNFDWEDHFGAEEMHQEMLATRADMSDDEVFEALVEAFPGSIDPVIGFDAPGFDGDTHDGAMDGLSDSDRTRLSRLQEIIDAPAWEFNAEQSH